MPGQKQEPKKHNINSVYKANKKTTEQLLNERAELLGGKSFAELSGEEQLDYCRLNRKIMAGYWKCFELAKEDKNYKQAALDFHHARAMGFGKARTLYNQIPEKEEVLEEQLDFSKKSDKNFITGLRYWLGLELPQNWGQSVRFLETAAQQGHAGAQRDLGAAYYCGKGVNKDQKEAVRWYLKAAEQENAVAQNNLGIAYWRGRGVNKDPKEAVRWYRKAAEQGNAIAQNNLGNAYAKGLGVKKDLKEAVRWFRMAAEQGYYGAIKSLKDIDTPLAKYTVALIQQNYEQAILLVLEHEEECSIFFEYDIVRVIQAMKDKESRDYLLSVLQIKAHQLNININSFLISALLSIDMALRTDTLEHNEETVGFLTKLLELAHFADAKLTHLKPLMHMICYLYDESESPEGLIKSLAILWYRAQTLEVPMNDSGLNRLIAARLVNGLFGNEYCLALTTTFQPGDLAQFILAFGCSPPLSMEVLNKRLSQPLLIASKYSPKQVLPRLMACISKAETWGGAIPPYMEEIIQHIKGQREDNPLDDKTAEKLLLKLKKTATRALGASKLRFLKQQFTPQEVELFRLIKKADTPKLLEWVETHEVSVELLNNR